VLRREQENEAERETNRENNRLIQKAHDAELDRVRAALNSQRLRIGPAICGEPAGSTQAGGASGSNGADTGGRVLSAEMDGAVKALIEETERAAATGRACQAFVLVNGMGE
jgi:hypothetical protein